jgi:hypothetical protein
MSGPIEMLYNDAKGVASCRNSIQHARGRHRGFIDNQYMMAAFLAEIACGGSAKAAENI